MMATQANSLKISWILALIGVIISIAGVLFGALSAGVSIGEKVGEAKRNQLKQQLDEALSEVDTLTNQLKIRPGFLEDEYSKVAASASRAFYQALEPSENKFSPGTMVEHADPVYPTESEGTLDTGTVWVEVYVDEYGRAFLPTILRASLDSRFQKAALDAAVESKFAPATFRGDPIGSWVAYSYSFKK